MPDFADDESGNTLPEDELVARDELLKSFLDEQAYLQSRIVSLREKIDDAQKDVEDLSAKASIEELESLKEEIGLSEVSGSGIEILLDDSPLALRGDLSTTSENLVQASDIRDLVNLLNAAGAEAISVNGQRVIATSSINSVKNAVLVNNTYLTPPFIIHAVGDTNNMLQRILNTNLLQDLYYRKENGNVQFEVAAKNPLNIPIYNGNLKVNYINLIE